MQGFATRHYKKVMVMDVNSNYYDVQVLELEAI